MVRLSKSRVLAHLQCPRRLWLQTYQPELADQAAGTSARLATGTQVGEVAQTQHANGRLLFTDDLNQALAETREALAEPPRPLFEAAFKAEGILVLADLLLPDKDGWRMVEVKSSASVKPYHFNDAAIQTWVANKAGVTLGSVEIAHIDTSFVYPGNQDYSGLFHYADITAEVEALQPTIPAWVNAAAETLAGEDPRTEPGSQCNDPFACPFAAHCLPPVDDSTGYPPEVLPYARKLPAQLREEGYADLRDVPAGRLTNAKHLRVWQATRDNQAFIDPQAGLELRQLPYPRYYVDFETIQMAVPVWAGTRPYSQIPFQWSCHIEQADGTTTHHEYLADGKNDPRPDFAESLVEVLNAEGPVFVYNAAFERTRMTELAAYYPQFAEPLHAAVERLVDLLVFARNYYYHPEMRGSWSIKKVLPTIAPELSYSMLAVADGGMAQQAFAEMMAAATTGPRHQELYQGLLEYCQLDTLAMVKIAHFFMDHADAE